MPIVSSSKAQEVHLPLLDDEKSSASSDSENSMLPTIAESTESTCENVDQDAEQDALGMQDHVVENEHESNPPESEEASVEE